MPGFAGGHSLIIHPAQHPRAGRHWQRRPLKHRTVGHTEKWSNQATEAEKALAARQIAQYKEIRTLVQQGS